MKLSQFKFKLPDEKIAVNPPKNRDEAKLMVLHKKTGEIEHRLFKDIIQYFDEGDTFIFNDTQVFPARLYGNKEKTGAKIEVFLLRELNEELRLWDVLVDPARKIRIGNKLYFGEDNSMVAEVIDNTTSRGRTLRFLYDGPHEEFKRDLYALGEAPIPDDVRHIRQATPEDIENIYMVAFEKGCKGITVFRDNCKRASILGFSSKKDEKTEKDVKLNHLEPIARKGLGPLDGRTYRKRTACVKALYVTVNSDENGDIFEIFTNKSTHGCAANIATITRLTSLALRSGIKVETIVQELKENSCPACQQLIKAGEKGVSLSCPYAIGEALEEEYGL